MNSKKYMKDAGKLLKDARSSKKNGVENYSERNDYSNYDGWKNLMTGLGTNKDKTTHTFYNGSEYLSDNILSLLWCGNGMAKKIIQIVADDMVREWISLDGDENNFVNKKLSALKVQKNINMALYWQRLFGGSIIVIGLNDGQEIYQPVNIKKIKSIDFLKAYDRSQVYLTNMNFNNDLKNKHYGNVEYYTVQPVMGKPFNVHHTRVLEFKGEPVPELQRGFGKDFWYWGMSVLQSIWSELKDFGSNQKNLNIILADYVTSVAKLKNLAGLLAEGKEDLVRKRMNAIDLQKSIINTLMIDADGEDYKSNSVSVGGLAEVYDRIMMFLSGVSGIPVTRLFGRSPAGQNSTGEADLINYYDMIKPKQEYDLREPIQKLIDYIVLSDEVKIDSEISFQFNKLFQLSETDEIKNRNVQAQTDQIYLQNGILTPEEVRKSRYSGGYNYTTEIDAGDEDFGFGNLNEEAENE
jgi:phage-related protein (TIGR01555 family)